MTRQISLPLQHTGVIPALLAATMVFAVTSPLQAQKEQTESAFSWSGTVENGGTLLIANINGSVDVQRSTSNRVEVTAEKRWRKGNPDLVRIEQHRSAQGVSICALWRDDDRCDESGIHHNSKLRFPNRSNDVSVRFTVRVPDGIRVSLSTVNGSLVVSGVNNAIEAETVNGSVNARSLGGPVRANTVNGSIKVAMGSTGDINNLEYSTVNGSITIDMPPQLGAKLDFSTVNGRISTDFPITISGTFSSRRLRGVVGNGETALKARTVNGSISLRRAP